MLPDHSLSASCPAKKQLTRMIPGGLTEARPATPEVQEIADQVSWGISGKSLIPNQTFVIWFKIWLCVKSVGNHRNQKCMGFNSDFCVAKDGTLRLFREMSTFQK